jgi:D-alanyl-D-alanine dipeptidase
MGRVLYPANRVLLREHVARRLSRVQDALAERGLGLKILDGYRPLSVQRLMWQVMPDDRYVADPAKGSRHNRGAAVDVTLVDSFGRELSMPCPYDEFSERAHRGYAGSSLAARCHRALLAEAMGGQGFTGLPTEWWHFDAPGWQDCPILDEPL